MNEWELYCYINNFETIVEEACELFCYYKCGHTSSCYDIGLKTMVLDKQKRKWCRWESFQDSKPCWNLRLHVPKIECGDISEILSLPASRTLSQVPKQEENHSHTILLGFSLLYSYSNSQNTPTINLEYYSSQNHSKTHPLHTNIGTIVQILGPSKTTFFYF